MSSYNHRIRVHGHPIQGDFEIAWTVDHYYPDSRLRFPRRHSRITDRKGAERFAKKWNVKMPEPPTG